MTNRPAARAISASKTAGGTNGYSHILTKDNINQNLLKAEYAVRGELAIRSEQLREELRIHPQGRLPFKRIVSCNIGNPQQLGQPPLTYVRQMLALMEYPTLMSSAEGTNLFPADVICKAKQMLGAIGGTTGAYSHSQGIPMVREAVAKFIEERDGYPTTPRQIFLTNGASDAVNRVLNCLITSPKSGIMVPIPQYPLYTAAITLLNGTYVPYYLDESRDWSLSIEELEKSYQEAIEKNINVKAMVVINPGNPTGNCLSEVDIKSLISFCEAKGILLLADEVYQENIYTSRSFISCRKVACQLKSPLEVISFHSTSKGLFGECGHRGGYFECLNVDGFILDQFYKLSSICLCANVPGQLLLKMMVDPPKAGDESFVTYQKERQDILQSLKRRALLLQQAFSVMEGVTCNEAAGAMYLFPQLKFPEAFIKHAEERSKLPDEIYAMDLLEATGICVVPGSGFGQKPGTWHIRTTFLPPESQFKEFIRLWQDFHTAFTTKWKGSSQH